MKNDSDLIVHIGQGKTGTSSIQRALTQRSELLKERHYKDLSINLSNCSSYKQNINYLDENDLKLGKKSEVFKCLENELSEVNDKTLIWSNETIFQTEAIIPILQQLAEAGHKLHVIVYIRRHDLWARSAHTQWCVKHKTKPGPVLSYSEWIEKTDIRYAERLKKWEEAFPNNFSIRNYEEISDVVSNFANFLDLPSDEFTISDINISPGKETIYAWSIFNSISNKPNLPYPFENFLSHQRKLNDNFDTNLPKENLLPSSDEINQILEDYRDDIELANSVLKSHGQEPFNFEHAKAKDNTIDNDKLIELLFKIVFNQQKQLSLFQRRLSRLESKLENS